MKWNHQFLTTCQTEFPVFQLTLAFVKCWLPFFLKASTQYVSSVLVVNLLWGRQWPLWEYWKQLRSCPYNSNFPLKSSDKFPSHLNILRLIARRFIKLSRTMANIFRNFARIKQKIHLLHAVMKTTSLLQTTPLCYDSELNFILHYPLSGVHTLHKPTQQSRIFLSSEDFPLDLTPS